MNISPASLRTAIQDIEKDLEKVLGQGSQPASAQHGQAGQGAPAGAKELTAARPDKPIDFGTPSDPSSTTTQPKSADQKNDADQSGSLNQMIEDILKVVMQFLQSLMQKNGDSGSDSGDSGSGSAKPAPHIPRSGVADQGGGAAAPAQAAPAAGNAPASAASGNTSVTGSGDLHLPPALEPYRADIQEAAQKTGMPASVIAGQIWAESRGDSNASSTNVNGKTDGGLMQVNADTAAEMKSENPDKFNGNAIHDNIMAGALYLRDQSKAFGGDIGAALRAYNSGPDKVNRNNLADVGGVGDPDYVKNVQHFAQIIGSGQGQLPA
ncbi:lytic transglycosylase domain-containing protein [Pseudomonas sp. ChxA]|uniref:lytic transglycosylase domain-containing protein n=1 Tax=Pseudomonas sp. ChxA TaxID=3035473 RepID=UPI0025553D0A|nr:lytic transglycosylase domain-containing protein [Pseudomonas sp. ChxA]MDL2186458.1 lytic transglycosylase domain-containing protein [Pseudomonas sp. ChxA]